MNETSLLNLCKYCLSNENLSIKARNRDGTVRIWICRECRRGTYVKVPHKRIYDTLKTYDPPKVNMKLWIKRAKENHKRIVEYYGRSSN